MGPKKNYDGEFDNDWPEKETGYDENDSCDSSDLPYVSSGDNEFPDW